MTEKSMRQPTKTYIRKNNSFQLSRFEITIEPKQNHILN